MRDESENGSEDALNRYGDDVVRTTGRHGADIASQRLDTLDKAALQHALSTLDSSPTAVDIGCGLGTQGIRFGLMGVETTLVDVLDISARIDLLQEVFEICELHFVNKDAKRLTADDIPNRIGTAYSQRFIHYLRFKEARDLLEQVVERMVSDGRVFVSASGLHSELGDGYPHKERPIEDRLTKLAPEMQEKHDIRDEICLYTVEDMKQLLKASGIEPIRVERSEFGNIKAVGEPKMSS